MMSAEQILERIGRQECVRRYLRGVEPGSETDEDARRAMIAAIHSMRASDIHDAMAEASPELYAQAALLLCRMWTDAEDGVADKIIAQYRSIALQLRYDKHNTEEGA